MAKPQNLDRDKLDFGNGKIGKLFRALFFPTLIGMIFNTVLTVVDGMFVGHGVGAMGIAAVNIVAPTFLLTTGIGLMFGIGASVVASIRLSENNVKASRIIMTQSLLAGLIIIGTMVTVFLLFPKWSVNLLGCSPELEEYAVDYLVPLAPGLIFVVITCIGMMLIRIDGSPKYAMWCQVIPATINIVLDYIMIFPLDMGVRGTALATTISEIIGGVMAMSYFIWFADKLKFYRLKLSLTSLLLTLRNVGYMAKIGFATFLTEVAMSVMMITGNFVFMKYLGENGVAAFAVACYLFPVVFSISNAVAQSAQPIISFNYGAHHPDRVHKTLNLALYTSIFCGILVMIGLCLGTKYIVNAFMSPTEPAFALAMHGLPLYAVCAIFFSVNITFIGYYQSIEDAVRSIIYTLLRGIIFVVPAFIFLPQLIGTNGLWLAIPTAEILTTAVIAIIFISHRIRKDKKKPL